jgi:hypothetical protein
MQSKAGHANKRRPETSGGRVPVSREKSKQRLLGAQIHSSTEPLGKLLRHCAEQVPGNFVRKRHFESNTCRPASPMHASPNFGRWILPGDWWESRRHIIIDRADSSIRRLFFFLSWC